MRLRHVIGFLSAALCVGVALVNAGVGWVERVFVWAYSTFARSFSMAPVWGDLATAGPAPSYDAPAPHFMRHEAGTSRRAAPRNI